MNETKFDLSGAGWRKARRSVGNGACVEVAALNGKIHVRDSKIADSSPMLDYPAEAWANFINATKGGQFDQV